MTKGFVSDVDGDDTVMQSPVVTIAIDPEQLRPEQALALIQQADRGQQDSYYLGKLAKGEDVTDELEPIQFHVPLDAGLDALNGIGVLQSPEPAEEEQQT